MSGSKKSFYGGGETRAGVSNTMPTLQPPGDRRGKINFLQFLTL